MTDKPTDAMIEAGIVAARGMCPGGYQLQSDQLAAIYTAMNAVRTPITSDVEGELDGLVVKLTELAVMELDADEENTLQIEAWGAAAEKEIRTFLAALTAKLNSEALVEALDDWNPGNEDPYWMLEIRRGHDDAGAWLKNDRTFSVTHDPLKALRYPSFFEADCARRRLPLTVNGRFEPTEHSWIAALAERGERRG